ncbi:hypothetical protein BESB_055710 [Besnoitia besnoiti]|uniref:Uncharacterized protein n=1 Tax=Besnoitia besnoiti TaxID=94643 RepID=A0A2A9MKG2_BESBE|nr:hypothetical protein BESB_055710 [Besnoitia besnoiti]PFH35920.1 hypothetical protein BESB_055710 [Besnoitia besnoiti]
MRLRLQKQRENRLCVYYVSAQIFGRLADVSTVGSVIASPVASPAAAAPMVLDVHEHVVSLVRSRQPELLRGCQEETAPESRQPRQGCGGASPVRDEWGFLAQLPAASAAEGAPRMANWDWAAWLAAERAKWVGGTHQSLLIQKKAFIKGRTRRRGTHDRKKWELLFERATPFRETEGGEEALDSGSENHASEPQRRKAARLLRDLGAAESSAASGDSKTQPRPSSLPTETSTRIASPLAGHTAPYLNGNGLDFQDFVESLLKAKFSWPLQPNSGAAQRSIQYMPAAYDLFLSAARRLPEGREKTNEDEPGESKDPEDQQSGSTRRHRRKKRSTYEKVNSLLQAEPISPDAIECVWRALTRLVSGPFGEVLPSRGSLPHPELEVLRRVNRPESGRRLYRGDVLRSIWEWAPADGLVDWESFLFFLDEVPADGVEPLLN